MCFASVNLKCCPTALRISLPRAAENHIDGPLASEESRSQLGPAVRGLRHNVDLLRLFGVRVSGIRIPFRRGLDCVFHFADGVLNLAFRLLGSPLDLHFCIASPFSGLTLDTACHIFHFAFNAIVVHVVSSFLNFFGARKSTVSQLPVQSTGLRPCMMRINTATIASTSK